MAKKAAAPKKSKAKKAAAEATTTEEALQRKLVQDRQAAADYLQRRDGMDTDTAWAVAQSMDEADIQALLVQEAHNRPMQEEAAERGAQLLGKEKPVPPDFTTNETLACSDLPELVLKAATAAKRKSEAEKEYKETKKLIDLALQRGGVDLKSPIGCIGFTLERYKGSAGKRLSDIKLLEKGVSVDIINECWTETEFDDVRISAPKEVTDAL